MAKKIRIVKVEADPDDDPALTMDEFREFLSAKTYEEQFAILTKSNLLFFLPIPKKIKNL